MVVDLGLARTLARSIPSVCLILALAPFLGIARPAQAAGNTYYVSPSGNDTHPGTLSQPWRTIGRAARSVAAGDIVYVRGGVYRESFELDAQGVTEARVEFLSYADEKPLVEGPGMDSGTAVKLSGSHIRFAGFEVRNSESGIEMTGDHLEVADCYVHDVTYGITGHGGCHDFTLTGVRLSRFFLYGFDASRWGEAEPVCHHGTFLDCRAEQALDTSQNVDGFAFGDGHDFVFHHCLAEDVYDGFDIKADRTVLNRCSASRCSNAGYKLWADGIKLINCLGMDNGNTHVELDWDGKPGTSTLFNCTMCGSQTYSLWVEDDRDRLRLFNCILADSRNIGLCFEQRSVAGYTGDHNIFHSRNADRAVVVGYEDEFSLARIKAGDWARFSGQDVHSLISPDPSRELFLDLEAGDLHLRPECMAVDSGQAEGAPVVDYDCGQRPSGEGYDIGAYEYGSALSPECPGETGFAVDNRKGGRRRR